MKNNSNNTNNPMKVYKMMTHNMYNLNWTGNNGVFTCNKITL